MQRFFLAILLLVPAAFASAQETNDNELELVRQLRIKGWNDLARTRIDMLLKRGDPALAAALPIELARINISEAREKPPAQRQALFDEARKQLQDFIVKNQGKPQAALAGAELARVTSHQAQGILSEAMREDEVVDRHKAAVPAEALFIKAGDELKQAIKSIEASINDPGSAAFKSQLEAELREAQLDVAINIFNRARTYIDRGKDAINEKRANTIKEAKDEFLKLSAPRLIDPKGKLDDKKKAEIIEARTASAWLADAWLMKIGMERTDPAEANDNYFIIMSNGKNPKANPAIARAVRLVGYFHLQDITPPREDAETIGNFNINEKLKQKKSFSERLHDTQERGEAWLKTYANYLRTFEGQGVRYEVAYAYFTEAFNAERAHESGKRAVPAAAERVKKAAAALKEATNDKDKKAAQAALTMAQKEQKAATDALPGLTANAAATRPKYNNAINHFDELAKLDGDLSERARQISLSIKFRTLNVQGEMRTFDDFMMKALIHRRSVMEASAKLEEHGKKVAAAKGDPTMVDALMVEKKGIDDERKKALKDVVRSLNGALALADTKTPVNKVDDARYYLSGAYLAMGDAYRGVLVSEALARGRSGARSAEAATNALQTYGILVARDRNNVILRQRMLDMASFVLSDDSQRLWKEMPVTSMAHYQLGLSVRESDPKKAIGHFMQIKATFPEFVFATSQGVFIAEAARADIKEKDPDNKKDLAWFIDAKRKLIDRLPKLNPQDESPTANAMYFFAKLERAKEMYSDAINDLNAREELAAVKKCNDMRKYVTDLYGEFDKLKGGDISPDNREQLDFTIGVMKKYADLGIAEAKFRSDRPDRFDEVIKATQTVVNATLDKAKAAPAGQPIRMRDYRITGDILGLALRANVQKGDVDKGKAILDVLQRLSGDNPDQKPGNVVAVLLVDISTQIDAMIKNNDKNLATTKTNYLAFLDVIAKEYEKKGFDNNSALMLARAYNSLDVPTKSVEMFARITTKIDFNKKWDKKNENDAQAAARQAWEAEAQRHWALQIEYIRVLRACKDTASLQKAEKLADAMVKHDNARYKIQAMMEQNFILEDHKKWVEAYQAWQKFLQNPSISGENLRNPEVQKIYFPGYFYYTRAMYKMGILDPRIKKPQTFIDAAAKNIIKLETAKTKQGWEIAGPLFFKYFKEKEAEQLKKAYDALAPAPPKKAMREPNHNAMAPSVSFVALTAPPKTLEEMMEEYGRARYDELVER